MKENNNEIKEITEDLTFSEVSKIPEFQEYKNYLMYSHQFSGIEESPFGSLKLSQISSAIPTWNGKAIAIGLNRLLELDGRLSMRFIVMKM